VGDGRDFVWAKLLSEWQVAETIFSFRRCVEKDQHTIFEQLHIHPSVITAPSLSIPLCFSPPAYSVLNRLVCGIPFTSIYSIRSPPSLPLCITSFLVQRIAIQALFKMFTLSNSSIDLAQMHSSLALNTLSEEDRKIVAQLKQTYPSHILAAIFQDAELSQGTNFPSLY
jgi:hypothetical protein